MFKLIAMPGEALPEEENVIAEASSRLDVGEFQVFQLGYAHWFGRDPEPREIEPQFFAYLMENRPPTWARHFAREIVHRDDQGELVSTDAEWHRYDRPVTRTPRWVGWATVVLTLALVAGFLALMVINNGRLNPGGCMFPPCP